MTILNQKGWEPELIRYANIIGHWLSKQSIRKVILKKRLMSKEDFALLQGRLDKASAARIIRKILFDKEALKVITAVVSTHQNAEGYKDTLGQLVQLREECKDLAKLSSLGLFPADTVSDPTQGKSRILKNS